MEKKTIGKFISALRRANGMTQKELGEKLFVSDKTVSRWERDECTPELSLIPAIAEIFGITTDELLRGERNTQQAETTNAQKGRSDKQFKLMLHNKMVKFRNLSMISVGVALVGLIVGAVIDISFSQGVLGCGVASAFILASIICQLCFASSAMLRTEEEEDYDREIRQANSRVTRTTAAVLMAILTVFALILPLGLFTAWGYTGLSFGGWMLVGGIFSVVSLVVMYIFYILWIRKVLVHRGLIWEDEQAALDSAGVRKLLKRMLAIACAVLVVLSGGFVLNGIAGPQFFAKGVTFYDMAEFKAYTLQAAIEERKSGLRDWGVAVAIEEGAESVDGEVVDGTVYPYDYILDEQGNVLAEYCMGAVYRLSFDIDEEKGAVEWVNVYTIADFRRSTEIYQNIQNALFGLMALDLVVCGLIYGIRLKKKY